MIKPVINMIEQKMKKKIFSLLIIVCMTMVLLSENISSVLAYTGTKYGDYLYYTELNGEIMIVDCDSSATAISIPERINSKKVTKIGYGAFYNCSSLESVTIPYSVTSIGNYAFDSCTGLISVTISNGVTSIGNYAFRRCSDLTNLTIPDSVSDIGTGAFQYCGITSITIGKCVASVACDAFYGCYSLETVNICDLKAYLNCKYETDTANPMYCADVLRLNGKLLKGELELPDGVTQIPVYAFQNCSSITSVTLPDSVITIDKFAFSECTGLKKVIIGKNVTSIGWSAFNYCSGLESVTISNSVVSIGQEAFYKCSSLVSITIPDSVISIEGAAFSDCSSLKSVIIGSNVTNIGSQTFFQCSSLSGITIPNSVTSIGSSAFCGCVSLTDIAIPDSVTSIGDNAFRGCIGLKNITIGNGVTSIEYYAFDYCTGLTSIIIPDSVKSLGNGVFCNCSMLTSIKIPDSITTIGSDTFYKCTGLTSVVIPKSVTKIDSGAFDATNLSLVFYLGDEEDWEEIYFASNNDDIKNATIIYNAKKKTYKLETNCESRLEDINDYAVMSSPTVKNGDKTLMGWYDNKSFTGSPVTFPYCGEATTLYASWTDRTGESFDDAFYVKANEEYSVSISESGQTVYYEFTPKITGEYRFYSKGSLDTYAYLYDSEQYQLTSNDDGGEGNNFRIVYDLTAGETYYIAVELYSGTGSFTLVTETDCIEGVKTVCVTANSGEKIFISIPSYLPEDASVILACYKGDMLVDVQIAPNKNETLYFIVKKDFDNAKVMVWESLSSMHPACEAENIGNIE